jgi:hypothetical protein
VIGCIRERQRAFSMELPKAALIEHRFDPQKIENIPVEVSRKLRMLRLQEKDKAG